MARRVFMHVGVAKTGTTYLQRTLHANRDPLRAHGLLYPGKRSGDQFVASIDLRGLDAEKYNHLNADGMWDRIAKEVNDYDGDAIISHETFARCSSADVRRVQESFGGAQIGVVLTVRDLGRQVPAVWQETVKNRATGSYGEFLNDVFVDAGSGSHKFFWRAQDVSKVVRRWGRAVGMSNVTVVTVPPPGAARDELWNRFGRAIELPEVSIALPTAAGNVSLGPAEAELLRQVNLVLPEDFPWPRYSRAVKRQFAEHKLARREMTRILIPPGWHGPVNDRAAAMVRYLEGSGCQIIGDLAELAPQLPTAVVAGPDDLTSQQLLRVAAEVIRDEVILRPSRKRPAASLAEGKGLNPRARALALRARALAARVRERVRRGA